MTSPAVPGSSHKARIASMLRVDHAGEYGAVQIYRGQMAVLGQMPATAEKAEMIAHMEQQEQVHLATFSKLITENNVRPTAMNPIWHFAGFALGAATALMGEKAAMACTAAVEEVIDEHYQGQLRELGDSEPELSDTIERFRLEEVEHRDIAYEHGAREAPGFPLLSGAIRAGCRLAIKISEKV